MKNPYLLSIIVPVYKVSKYLKTCLDSIINQTLKDIEIILINDFSPDEEDDKICKEYQEKDNRIKYIVHKKNLGLGGARNTGIKEANALYIGFVDSDDYIDNKMFETMYKRAIQGDFDVVECDFLMIYENKRKSKKNKKEEFILKDENILKEYVEKDKPKINGVIWNKIYKKNLFLENNVLFKEHIYREDLEIFVKILYFCKSYLILKDHFYYYLQREGSITKTKSKQHLESIFIALKSIKTFLKEKEIKNYKNYYKRVYALEISKCSVYFYNKELKDYFLQKIKENNYFLIEDLDEKELPFIGKYLFYKDKKTILLKELLKELNLFKIIKYLYKRIF